jgi:4-carboxymuconolactone decarboxylase
MARVTLVAPEQASAEQQAAFTVVAAQRGRVGNLFRAMVHSPELAGRVGQVGAYLRYDASLPDRLRESVILAVSRHWHAEYERQQHEVIARGFGLSDAAMADLRAGQVPTDVSPLEGAAVRYAQALLRDGQGTADLLQPLVGELGERGLVELHILVGYYSMIGLFLNGLQVDLEQPSVPA